MSMQSMSDHLEYKLPIIDSDEYCVETFGDFDVIIRKKDGFVNATKLCTAGGKRFDNWMRTKCNKKLIIHFKRELNVNVLEIIQCYGENNIRGSYVHPLLVPHIAMWCSPEFAFNVSQILEKWKKLNSSNNAEYWQDMARSLEIAKQKADDCDYKESCVRDMIATQENGAIEVKAECGYIDILTDTKVIEIKRGNKWKHAIGQVLCYAIEHKEKEPWIYLFDYDDCDCKLIEHYCAKLRVNVKFVPGVIVE